jgi:hypothetical protein
MTYVSPGADVDAADINFIADRTIDRPACRVTASAAQAFANNVTQACLFGAEDYDTAGMHDITTLTSRFVPPAGYPGYYQFDATLIYGAGTDYQVTDAWFRKNGTVNLSPSGRRSNTTGSVSSFQAIHCHVTVFLDPVAGDYLELMGVQTNVAATSRNTAFSGQANTTVEGNFLRR